MARALRAGWRGESARAEPGREADGLPPPRSLGAALLARLLLVALSNSAWSLLPELAASRVLLPRRSRESLLRVREGAGMLAGGPVSEAATSARKGLGGKLGGACTLLPAACCSH